MGDKQFTPQERYKRWSPIQGLPDRLLLDSLTDNSNGLEIALAEDLDSPKRILIHFDLSDLVGYRVTNDSFTWRSDSNRIREEVCSLNVVENSDFLEWFVEETYGAADLSGAIHYALLLAEEGIDIVSRGSPEVCIR